MKAVGDLKIRGLKPLLIARGGVESYLTGRSHEHARWTPIRCSPPAVTTRVASFVPMSHYLLSSQVPALLQQMGHELVIHTVITGGQALLDTVNGFAQLVTQFPEEALFIVWLNPYWGPIEHEGKGFEHMKVYAANKDRISAIVRIPSLKEETFGRDLSDMLQERLTFDDALATDSRTIMSRQRLKLVKGQLFAQMDTAAVL